MSKLPALTVPLNQMPTASANMVTRVPARAQFQAFKYGITHFLRIPYATRESTPQLLKSLQQVAEDPIASELPREAWLRPDQLLLGVGLLRLETEERLKGACRLLHEFANRYRSNAISNPPGT